MSRNVRFHPAPNVSHNGEEILGPLSQGMPEEGMCFRGVTPATAVSNQAPI